MNKKTLVYVDILVHYISLDIINAFASKYDKVVLLTGFIRKHERPLRDNVEVVKLKKYNRTSFKSRIWSWAIYSLQVWIKLLFKYKGADVFFTSKPPIPQLYGLITRRKFAVQILDVYPDILKVHNITDKNIIYKGWSFLNKKIFDRAIEVTTISKKMKDLVDNYIISNKKSRIVHLWSGFGDVKKIDKINNNWLKELELQNYFIVQYAGNIGHSYNVEALLNAAEKLKEVNDIKFIIIGWGERYKTIENIIEIKKLVNVKILPMQPIEVLEQSLSAADISVILLEEKIADVSLPSKLYNLQNLGIPILCFAPNTSELFRHVAEFKNGVCFRENDTLKIANFILECKNNPTLLKEFSENSLKAAKEFSFKNADKFTEPFLN